MLNWLWNGNDVTEDVIPESAVGFVYKIEHIPTGKYYIGKKSLQSVRNVKIGVRELQRIKENSIWPFYFCRINSNCRSTISKLGRSKF